MSLIALGVISLMALIWISRQWRTLEQGFAGTLVATVLVSYHLNPHDLVLLLIPLALALRDINYASISGVLFLFLALPILPRLALASHCFPLVAVLIAAFGFSFWRQPVVNRDISCEPKNEKTSP
jgi:hypothetical protein